MVDYSQFVFHERDHSYGYAEEVSVSSGGEYGYPYTEERPLVYQYQLVAAQSGAVLLPDDGGCQDLPLNLSLNGQGQQAAAEPVSNAAYARCAEDEESGPAAPQLGSEFIVCDLGAHIAQEEIVESEVLVDEQGCEQEDEDEQGEDESSEEDEEGEGVHQALSNEVFRNSRLRSKVNDLTKVQWLGNLF